MILFVLAEKWLGLDGLGERELQALRVPAEKAILKALLLFEREVKKKLTGSRSGRVYTVGRRGRTHQASAPGEPPAVLTGALRQSITHDGPTWQGDEVSGEVGTQLPYAAILEFGGMTWNGGRILPRPYMAATFLEQQDAIETILQGATKT